MAKLIHIRGYHDKQGKVKFSFTDWTIEKVEDDVFFLWIDGDPKYSTTMGKDMVGRPFPETRTDVNDQFGWILAEEGKEEEAKAALILAAKKANEETINKLKQRIEAFAKKASCIDVYLIGSNA